MLFCVVKLKNKITSYSFIKKLDDYYIAANKILLTDLVYFQKINFRNIRLKDSST